MAKKYTPQARQHQVLSFESLPKQFGPHLPTLAIDAVQMLTRAGRDSAILRFYTFLPEAAVEACRVQASKAALLDMINVLTKSMDYYPERPLGHGKAATDARSPALEAKKGLPRGNQTV